MADCRANFNLAGQLPNPAPSVVQVQGFASPARFFIEFDVNVTVAGGADPAQFTGRWSNRLRSGITVSSFSPKVVKVELSVGTASIGPNLASYSAASGGVTSTATGIEAEPFVDFPVT